MVMQIIDETVCSCAGLMKSLMTSDIISAVPKATSNGSYEARQSFARVSARIASRLAPLMRPSLVLDRRQPLAALPRSNC